MVLQYQNIQVNEHFVLPPASLAPIIPDEQLQVHIAHHAQHILHFNSSRLFDHGRDRENKIYDFYFRSHMNHSFFWSCLAHPGSELCHLAHDSLLFAAISEQFLTFDRFCNSFADTAINLCGSGWVWLTFNKDNQKLFITTTENENRLEGFTLVPLLAIDVWEHAYFATYGNDLERYIRNIFSVVNWQLVSIRYMESVVLPY